MRRTLVIVALLFAFGAVPAFAGLPASSAIPVKKAKTKTGIAWQVTPESAVIYLDGRRLGTAGKLTFTKARPGKHTIKMTKGGDEAELEVKVVKGQVLQLKYAFSE